MKLKSPWKKTTDLIPCGVQTLSKMPNKHVEGVYPIYIEEGQGCYVFSKGRRYIDYPCSLGAILLGHNYYEVSQAIRKQLDKGIIFSLPSFMETELAEELKEMFPYADKFRFLKTGSEATSAAVKIARAYTGRDNVGYCGFHGWHDWYTVNTQKNAGIPKDYLKYTKAFKYNDIESVKKILDKNTAALILEPYIYEAPGDFLSQLISCAHANGTLVLFDEVVTGFRTFNYSAANLFNVTPDISCFGKAMANGLPISVVCGKKDIMNVLEDDCFVSSTFGGELLSIAAALATIRVLKTQNVIEHIYEMGDLLKGAYNDTAEKLGIETRCVGFPNRTMFMFPTNVHKGLFWQECIKDGVFFGYAQFISFSHRDSEICYTIEVIKNALKVVQENWDNPIKKMEGKVPAEVFRLVATKETNG